MHDHSGTDTTKIRAYDRAGYGALSLMTYSGVDSLAYSWRERRWPVDRWLTAKFIESLENIKIWYPNAEEIGYDHVLSPFMEGYIRKSTTTGDLGYTSTQECVAQIVARGGLAVLAHPWTGVRRFSKLTNLFAVEIYSAFAEYRRLVVKDSAFVAVDRNAQLVANWDTLLMTNPAIRGIAVNDHYGPDNASPALPAPIRDSGKIVVLVGATDLASLRLALAAGRFFAIRDVAARKDGYPRIDSLHVDDEAIEVFGAAGNVRWIGNGRMVHAGARLSLKALPADLRYVRGEVVDLGGGVLYTQAFRLALSE
ncbi:MAG: hypothetical protein ACKVZ0_11440 [Gemmatimonadales bacterium]